MKRHKLVHNGGFSKFEVLYRSQNAVKSIKIQYLQHTIFQITKFQVNWKAIIILFIIIIYYIVYLYYLLLYYCFWMYPPLWTSLLVSMHDDIKNTSITK